MSDCNFVYITTKDKEEALSIARAAVKKQLARCANILPTLTSVYEWQDQINEDDETLLILKTTTDKNEALTSLVKELHSYDCPCVVTLPITGGDEGYLNWLSGVTTK